MFPDLKCQSWVFLTIEQWFKQAHCVRDFMKIDMVMFYYLTIEKSDTMC